MTMMIAVAMLATTLTADPAHSTAGFAVKHMKVTTVRGTFDKFTSTLDLDDHDLTHSKVDVTIDAASVNTRNEKRDGHLKSPDFFDAQKCPQITFHSKKIAKAGGKYKVTGDLTMHCQTKPVTLDVAFTDQPMKSPFGPLVYSAQVDGKLKRSDFGLVWNKAIEGGGVLVSDDVDLDLNLEYAPKQAAEVEKKAEAQPAKR